MSAKRKNIIFLSVMVVVLLAFAVLLQVKYCSYKYTDIPERINFAESNAKYEIENVEFECMEIREFEEISSEGILKAKWIYRFKNEDDVIAYVYESETELDYEINKLYVFQRITCQYPFSENSNYIYNRTNLDCLSKDELIARTREDVREEIKKIAHNNVEHTRDTCILIFIIVILVFFVVLVLWLLRDSDYDEETTEDEQRSENA